MVGCAQSHPSGADMNRIEPLCDAQEAVVVRGGGDNTGPSSAPQLEAGQVRRGDGEDGQRTTDAEGV